MAIFDKLTLCDSLFKHIFPTFKLANNKNNHI